MNANISLHPALDCYYKKFLETPNKPSGVLFGDMDELKISESVHMEGGYFVCARKIHLNLAKDFHFAGPGGGLIAAKTVQIAAPTIILSGDELHRVTIVALDCLNLQSWHFQLNYVTIVLMPNTYVKIDLSVRRFEHLKVIEIDVQGKEIRQFALSFEGFMRYLLEKKQRTQDANDLIDEQRATVKKIGLKSPLINPIETAPLNFFGSETKIPEEFVKALAAAEIGPILKKIEQQNV